MEDLHEIFADFPPQDMTNHSIFTNETLTNTLKSTLSDLSIQKETILSFLLSITIYVRLKRIERIRKLLGSCVSHPIVRMIIHKTVRTVGYLDGYQ